MAADALKSGADSLAGRIVGWRRELHAHPELGFQEQWTAAFLSARLERSSVEMANADNLRERAAGTVQL